MDTHRKPRRLPHAKQLRDFEIRLANRQTFDSAWNSTFPEFESAKLSNLDRELASYAKHGEFKYYSQDAQSDAQHTEQPMSAAEARALLLDGYFRIHPEPSAFGIVMGTAIAVAFGVYLWTQRQRYRAQ